LKESLPVHVDRRRPHHFSKKMLGGIIFVLTSFAGGFLASVGANMYSLLREFFSTRGGVPLTVSQVVFLLIGAVGLGLIISDLTSSQEAVRRRKGGRFDL
jgi:hypothetical protein